MKMCTFGRTDYSQIGAVERLDAADKILSPAKQVSRQRNELGQFRPGDPVVDSLRITVSVFNKEHRHKPNQ
jgi:hypothetical protein